MTKEANLLAAWEQYRTAYLAFNEHADIDDNADPYLLRWNDAWEAMRQQHRPVSLAEAAAALRYVLVRTTDEKDWNNAALDNRLDTICDLYRERGSELCDPDHMLVGALLAVECFLECEASTFIAAWLERWLHHGGSVSVGEDGKAYTFIPVNASDAPNYVPPPDDLDESARERQFWHDEGYYTGATRELLALLDAHPWAREGLKAHVATLPGRVAVREGRFA